MRYRVNRSSATHSVAIFYALLSIKAMLLTFDRGNGFCRGISRISRLKTLLCFVYGNDKTEHNFLIGDNLVCNAFVQSFSDIFVSGRRQKDNVEITHFCVFYQQKTRGKTSSALKGADKDQESAQRLTAAVYKGKLI